MDGEPFEIETDPTAQDIEFLEDRLYEHNVARMGKDDGQVFAIFVRNARNEIVAGISGWTWAGACEIRSLWVHPELRGQAYGRRLLQAAEREAIARGCHVVSLASYSFQAPEFYQKFGYEIAFVMENFPPGHKNFYFQKQLR